MRDSEDHGGENDLAENTPAAVGGEIHDEAPEEPLLKMPATMAMTTATTLSADKRWPSKSAGSGESCLRKRDSDQNSEEPAREVAARSRMEPKILKKPDGLSESTAASGAPSQTITPKRNDQAMRADFLDTSTEPIPRNKKVVEILTGWRVGADKHGRRAKPNVPMRRAIRPCDDESKWLSQPARPQAEEALRVPERSRIGRQSAQPEHCHPKSGSEDR